MSSKNKPGTLLAWSSGKDSAWTLHKLRQANEFEVVGLLTTFNQAFDRVAMHAVRHALVTAQTEAVELPLYEVPLPWPCSNTQYEQAMRKALKEVQEEFAVTHVAHGDLFLEDVRQYRHAFMQSTGLTPLFPIWGERTEQLAREMVESGLRARITCIDPKKLSPDFAGRIYDNDFLDDLPEDVDPCGEFGEFHTFAYAGPMFHTPIPVTAGEVVERDGFVFADII